MSNLVGLLHLGAAGLAAQHTGAAVAANNAANVNTAGYSRQRVDLRSQLAAPLVGGVRSGSPMRVADEMLATRERVAAAANGFSRSLAGTMKDFEARLATTGNPIEQELADLWTSFERVAAMPTDPLVRDAAVASATSLAYNIGRRATEITTARQEADARIVDNARSATTLASEIAYLNKAMVTSSDPVLRDRRDLAAGKLADLVGGAGRIDPDGMMRWTLPDGAVIVDGDRAASITTTMDTVTGLHKVEIVDGASRRDVTATLGGGALGADLSFRDVESTAAGARLDQLAYDIAKSLNDVHVTGAALDGTTGRNLFTVSATVTGAAASLAIDPAIAADSRLLAVGTPGLGPGDNQGALALLATRNQNLASGGTRTLGDAAIAFTSEVGVRTAELEAYATRDASVAEHLAGMRDALSGVDLDEELSNLVQFQHASEAMTRFLGTIDGMLSDLLSRI